jgi:magnesium-transporting ATPase (P-type)
MLWVNMIMDTFAALALATEPPHERLLLKPPHDRDSYIVTKRILKHIGFQAIF